MPLATYGDYEIEATALDPASDTISVVCEDDRDQYSVYERLPPDEDAGHRYARWVADFAIKDDAMLFAKAKSEGLK